MSSLPAATNFTPPQIVENMNKASTVEQSKRMFNPDLMALRASLPFLQIEPFPNATITVVLEGNKPLDVNIPDGVKMIRMKGSGVYFVSRNGNAQLPPVTPGVYYDGPSGLLNPQDVYYYVEEVRSLSIIAGAAVTVTISLFSQG